MGTLAPGGASGAPRGIRTRAQGDPERVAQAEELVASVDQIRRTFEIATDAGDAFREGAGDAFQARVRDLASNVDQIHNLEDAFRSLASTVSQALQQIAADLLSQQLRKGFDSLLGSIGSLFGDFFTGAPAGAKGGQVKVAGGGLIAGPGTPTSDSIPAWLSDGEFVMRSAAVQKYGADFMRAINAGLLQPQPIDVRRIPRFAGGGTVEFAGATKFDGRLQIGLAPGLKVESTDYSTPEGMRVLIQQAGKYRNAMRQALGV